MNFRLPFNVFDVILLGVALLGIMRGRKHGMSEELMNVFKWVLVVVVGAFSYQSLGEIISGNSPFSLLTSYIVAYLLVGGIILGIFALVKHSLGGKLIGSDLFGRAEYYLGMGSGLVRFGCITLFVLAILNARYFTPTEVRAMEKFQDDVYGSNFFPTLHTAQSAVFETSLTGPLIREYLDFLLIKPTQPAGTPYKQQEYAMPQ